MPFPTRKIGDDDVSALGLGCMGMSFGYTSFGGYDDKESLNVLTRSADLGLTFWDTSDVYGPHTNEKLIGKWFKESGRRKEIFLATKFANYIEPGGSMVVRGDAPYVKEACAASLERLGTDKIDLYCTYGPSYPPTPSLLWTALRWVVARWGPTRHHDRYLT